MKNINKSSVGGRRNRDPRNENDQEKQAMTGIIIALFSYLFTL